MADYYRRFIIPNFSKVSKRLSKLLQKMKQFLFGSECVNSLHRLKDPDFDDVFVLTTDAILFLLLVSFFLRNISVKTFHWIFFKDS